MIGYREYAERARNLRDGARQNEDGSESTVIMVSGEADGRYIAHPTLFQDEEGNWYEPDNPFEEAKRKGEIFDFGDDEEASIAFAKGAWKQEAPPITDVPASMLAVTPQGASMRKAFMDVREKELEDESSQPPTKEELIEQIIDDPEGVLETEIGLRETSYKPYRPSKGLFEEAEVPTPEAAAQQAYLASDEFFEDQQRLSMDIGQDLKFLNEEGKAIQKLRTELDRGEPTQEQIDAYNSRVDAFRIRESEFEARQDRLSNLNKARFISAEGKGDPGRAFLVSPAKGIDNISEFFKEINIPFTTNARIFSSPDIPGLEGVDTNRRNLNRNVAVEALEMMGNLGKSISDVEIAEKFKDLPRYDQWYKDQDVEAISKKYEGLTVNGAPMSLQQKLYDAYLEDAFAGISDEDLSDLEGHLREVNLYKGLKGRARDAEVKRQKAAIREDIEEGGLAAGFRDVLDVTPEYYDKLQGTFVGGAVLGLGETLPALVMPGGAVVRTGAIASQQMTSLMNEMDDNPAFADISESEKMMVAAPIALVTASLERLGFDGALNKSAIIQNITKKALQKMGPKTGAEAFSKIVENEIRSAAADGAIRFGRAGLSEGFTGGAQTAVELGAKDLYNDVIKGKEFFEGPEAFSRQYTIEVLKGAGQEAIGGGLIGAPIAVAKASSTDAIQNVPDYVFDLALDAVTPGKIEATRAEIKRSLANRVRKGEITKQQGETFLKDFNEFADFTNDIGRLDVDSKKKAYRLFSEQRKLKSEISRAKNKNLVAPQQNRLQAIDQELQKIATDAFQKQEARDIPDAERAEGVQEVEEEVREQVEEPAQEEEVVEEAAPELTAEEIAEAEGEGITREQLDRQVREAMGLFDVQAAEVATAEAAAPGSLGGQLNLFEQEVEADKEALEDIQKAVTGGPGEQLTFFQLETKDPTDERSTRLRAQAEKLFEDVQPELVSESNTLEVPDAETIPVVVTENTELAAKVPKISLSELQGKKANLLMADALKVDDKRMGGPFFPLQDGIFGKVAWASIDKSAASSIVRGAAKGDVSLVYNMGPTAVFSNIATFEELNRQIKKTRKPKKIFKAMMDRLQSVRFDKKKGETAVTERVHDIARKSKSFDSLIDNVRDLGVDTRADIIKAMLPTADVTPKTEGQILLKEAGITQESITASVSEQFASDLPMGAITMALEITDSKGNKVTEDTDIDDVLMTPEQQRAEGIPVHPNYPIYIRGRAVAMLKDTLPFWNVDKAARDVIDLKIAGQIKDKGRMISSALARATEMRRASMQSTLARTLDAPTKTKYAQFVDRLAKSFPSVEVVTDKAAFGELLKDLQAKKLVNKTGKVYGATLGGKLYLNPGLENYNTPIHEYGHIWLNTIKELQPETFQKGLDLVRGTEYVTQVEENPAYQKVIKALREDGATDAEIDQYVLEEALATAIGDKGESFVSTAQKRNFKNWLNELFEFIKKLTGISKLTAEQVQDLNFDDFLNAAVADILSEAEVFEGAQVEGFADQLQLMAKEGESQYDETLQKARELGISKAALRAALKRRGFDESVINEIVDRYTAPAREADAVVVAEADPTQKQEISEEVSEMDLGQQRREQGYVGRGISTYTAALPMHIKNLFGSDAGRKLLRSIGFNEFNDGINRAGLKSNAVAEGLRRKFGKKKLADGSKFSSQDNTIERNILGFLRRTPEAESERNAEFKRRLNLMLENARAARELGKAKLADAIDRVVERLDLKALEGKTYEEAVAILESKVDPMQLEAVQFWNDTWADDFESTEQVALDFYDNKIKKERNFVTDVYEMADGGTQYEQGDRSNLNIYTGEAATLKEILPPTSLFKDGVATMFINMDFENNQSRRYDQTAKNVETARAVFKVQEAIESSKFKDAFTNPEDQKIIAERLKTYLNRERLGAPEVESESEKRFYDSLGKVLNPISKAGAVYGLSGVSQPIAQVIPMVGGAAVKAGPSNMTKSLVDYMNQRAEFKDFLRRTDQAINFRGIQSDTAFDAIADKTGELIAEGTPPKRALIKALKLLDKAGDISLQTYIGAADALAAEVSFGAYYLQGLERQGLSTDIKNWAEHNVNKEAAEYAQDMVDEQQAQTKRNLQGELFASKKPLVRVITRAALPFATHTMNMKHRLVNSAQTLASKKASNLEKKDAARDILAVTAESAMFHALKQGLGFGLNEIFDEILSGLDREERTPKEQAAIDKRKQEERRKTMMRNLSRAYTSLLRDLAPVPALEFPIVKQIFDEGIKRAGKQLPPLYTDSKGNEVSGLYVYDGPPSELGGVNLDVLGVYGVGIDNFMSGIEKIRGGLTGELTKEYFGKKSKAEVPQEYREAMVYAGIAEAFGPLLGLPSQDVSRFSRALEKEARIRQTEIKRPAKFDSEKLFKELLSKRARKGGRTNREQLKLEASRARMKPEQYRKAEISRIEREAVK